MTGPREWRHAEDVLLNQYGRTYEGIVKTLLAQTPEGEGVYIAPDGTLMRAEIVERRAGGRFRARLVPIEEATDD